MTNNYTGCGERAIITQDAYKVEVSDIVDIGVHFTSGNAILAISDVGSYSGYGTYITVFKCDNISGHQVDYTKLDEFDENEYDDSYARELEKYGISNGCNSEEEIIIENAKFKVISIEDDELYGKRDEDGALGVRVINVKMI